MESTIERIFKAISMLKDILQEAFECEKEAFEEQYKNGKLKGTCTCYVYVPELKAVCGQFVLRRRNFVWMAYCNAGRIPVQV